MDITLLATPLGRSILGAVAAVAVAGAGHRAGSLSAGGAVAAVAVGTAAVGAGWEWGVVLVAFFVATSAISRMGGAEKSRRIEGIVAKGGARDAAQVFANGGVFAAAALGQLLWPHAAWSAAGLGALAAAAADSWATEIGTLSRGRPRLIVGLRPAPPGTSGAVTGLGTAGAAAGALFIAAVGSAAGWPPAVVWAAAVGGLAGALADSLIGATVQSRRRCDRCDSATERIVHGCGSRTRAAGGLPWLDNDVVNLVATAAGAAVSLALHHL